MRLRWIALATAERLARRALEGGAPINGPGLIGPWRISGSCERPVTVEHVGSEYADQFPRKRKRIIITLEVPCRKCDMCLSYKAKVWRSRMVSEYLASKRTWFVTLTFSPARLFSIKSKLRSRDGSEGACAHGGLSLPLKEPESWKEYEQATYGDVQRFLKRLRERVGRGVPLSVCSVTEKHPGDGPMHGEPHYHMLIHELDASAPVRHKMIKQSWPYISSAELLRSAAGAAYVAKYISEDMEARVRASSEYGDARLAAMVSHGLPEKLDPPVSSALGPWNGERLA